MTLAERVRQLRQIEREVVPRLKEIDKHLTPATAEVLLAIAEHRGPVTSGEIAAQIMGASEGSVRWQVADLVRRGYVRYVSGEPRPGRPSRSGSNQLTLTRLGWRIATQLKANS